MPIAHESSEATDSALGDLYRGVWRVCAGWNRKPFREGQLFFIRKRAGLLVMAQPLGSIEAMTTIIDDCRVVILNSRFLPRRSMSDAEILEFLGSDAGAYPRFVFLHEVAHQLFHEFAFLHTPWAETLSEVRCEIEADFYALLAVVPDRDVFEKQRANRSRVATVEAIANALGAQYALDASHREGIFELADYRLALFEMYSSAFKSISASPFEDGLGYAFRNVRTFDNPHAILETVPVDTFQILALHPYVKRRPTVIRQLLDRGTKPFACVAAAPVWHSNPRQPLTHRMDATQLLACLPHSAFGAQAELRWRTVPRSSAQDSSTSQNVSSRSEATTNCVPSMPRMCTVPPLLSI